MRKNKLICKRYFLLFINLLLISTTLLAQETYKTAVDFENGEYWWGGAVALGSKMPYIQPLKEFNLAIQHNNNQIVPLFVSSKGRYIWSDKPFRFTVNKKSLLIDSDYEKVVVQQSGSNLKSAYLEASQRHLTPTGDIPKGYTNKVSR